MGGRVHPLKRSVSWVNSVQRQFLAYGPILFLVPVSEATWNENKSRIFDQWRRKEKGRQNK